ncbi:MAG: biotin/lipoate--protein ligase family protein [Hyphomicrobiaceae bacterium]
MNSGIELDGGLDLPPGFRAVTLREHRDAFSHACAIATEEGAGTLVWVRRFDAVEIAVVLEPEEPLVSARRAIYAVLNAAGDAIAAHCPPEKPLSFAWPDTILLDGGILGGARLAWPPGASELEPPDWLVAGVVLRMSVAHRRGGAPGGHALDLDLQRGTSLEIEGFEMMDAAGLIGSFARHLLHHVDRWQANGFKPEGEAFLARLPAQSSIRRGIDGNGDLLQHHLGRPGAPERQALVPALAQPQWLDPETGEPWL